MSSPPSIGFGLGDFLFRSAILGPFYLVIAAVTLIHFGNIHTHLFAIARGKLLLPSWLAWSKSLIVSLSQLLTKAFGKATAFEFGLTQVLLVAVLLALLSVASAVNSLTNELHEQRKTAQRVNN